MKYDNLGIFKVFALLALLISLSSLSFSQPATTRGATQKGNPAVNQVPEQAAGEAPAPSFPFDQLGKKKSELAPATATPPAKAAQATGVEPAVPQPPDQGLTAGPAPQPQQFTKDGQPVSQTTNANGEELVYLNVQDADIKDIIKQISKATGRNFIIDDKIKGKVTIVSERPMTREEAYQTFLSALEVAGYTIVKGPAGVIKLVPLKEAAQQPIPTHVDSTPFTDMFITRLIPLQNISAVEMSNAIKGLVSKEGNLFAYPATNTLIITDSGTNIDRLMKIIKELDQEGPQQVMEIIPVLNASASAVGQMVNQLFEQEKAKAAASKGKKGGELEDVAEVSKIIPDERTNSIIVLASKRAIDSVRSIIARLDRKLMDGQEGRIHVYYLRHAKAKEMAETLSTLTAASGASPKKDAKGVATGPVIAEFEGGVKIAADESTNSLIITSTPKDFQVLVEKVISKLDIQRRQVYLESVIMELYVKNEKTYGLAGAFGGITKGPVRIFGSDPFSNLLNGFLSGTGSLPSDMIGGVLGSGTIPVTIGDQTRNIPSVGIFMAAMANYGDANIVSTPNILTLDNQEAKIEVKETAYYTTQSLSGSGISVPSTQSADAGLTMKITPQIGEGDHVKLKIEQTLSGFLQQPTQNDKVPPPTKNRSISTTVVSMDGQTVVLGGLMEDKVSNSKKKIPILGDIPILGNLFKETTQSKQKVNLLIFITPHVIKDTSDFNAILKKKIEQRNQFIESNYGKKQRKMIRQSISDHSAELLDYKGPPVATTPAGVLPPTGVSTAPIPTPQSVAPAQPLKAVTAVKPAMSPATAVPITQGAKVSPASSTVTPTPSGKQPVITVQPQGDTSDVYKAVQQQSKPLATTSEPTSSTKPAKTPVEPRVKPPSSSGVVPPAPGARGSELDLTY